MYTIYFNEKKIIIGGPDFEPIQEYSSLTCYHNDNLQGAVAGFLSAGNFDTLNVVCDDLDKGWNDFRRCFTEVNAGGGLIRNDNGEYLMIFRLGVWDLPKGKQEPGEDIRETAAREVQEECGIPRPRLGDLICVTHHIYRREGLIWLKHTHWFKMFSEGRQLLKPQTEEDIASAVWVSEEEMMKDAGESYPSIREVISYLQRC